MFAFQIRMNVRETHVHTENASTPQGLTSVSVLLDSSRLQPGQSAEVTHTQTCTHTYNLRGCMCLLCYLFVSARSG